MRAAMVIRHGGESPRELAAAASRRRGVDLGIA
jgi:hypothetical protein